MEAVKVVAQVKNNGFKLKMQVGELREETNASNFLPLFSGILRRRNKSRKSCKTNRKTFKRHTAMLLRNVQNASTSSLT